MRVNVWASPPVQESVSSSQNTYIFNVSTKTTDPEKSAEMANALAQIYLDDGRKLDIEIPLKGLKELFVWMAPCDLSL